MGVAQYPAGWPETQFCKAKLAGFRLQLRPERNKNNEPNGPELPLFVDKAAGDANGLCGGKGGR
jgi:hypothetical protein